MAEYWKTQWEKLLIESLNEQKIQFEKTAFKISVDLKKARDGSWDNTINSGQIVNVINPKKKGSTLKLQAINRNSLPVLIGTVDFYDEERTFSQGIICQLIEKQLDYSSGKTKSCLDFDQPIILLESDKIPQEILSSKTLRLKSNAKSTGCLSSIALLASTVIFTLVYLFTFLG